MTSLGREKRNAQHRSWYSRNLERGRELGRIWYAEHRDKVRKYRNDRRTKIKLEVLKHYSQGSLACACCGLVQIEFLTIDHINGRTPEDDLGGRQLYELLKRKNFPSGYQVLCFNCNQAKGLFGACPHTWPTNIKRRF